MGAENPPLTNEEKKNRILEILRARSQGSECQISLEELSSLCGWSPKTVGKYLRELEREGLLSSQRRRRQPKVYRIVDPHPRSEQRPEGSPLERIPGGNLTEEFRSTIRKGGRLLLLGPEGIGKSYRLSEVQRDGLSRDFEAILPLRAGPPKEFLLQLVTALLEAGLLDPEEAEGLRGMRVQELLDLVKRAVSGQKVLLLIDDLDRATPRLRRELYELLEEPDLAVVATATEEEKLGGLTDHFFVREIPPLSRSEVYAWVDSFIRARGITVQGGRRGLERLKEYIYSRSRGIPRKVQALLAKVEVQGHVDPKFAREELVIGGRVSFIDMTWIIVLTAAIALAIRYLSLGLHDRLLYVLAGFAYAGFFVLRFFSYRWRRR
ncbi:helix-turn-helix domain-containing protein [Candidatus Bipolaricaulota bacterium]|nr:helix-turn-helix domain-containing protein [Candidatus Bipolaricaulota bacterium]